MVRADTENTIICASCGQPAIMREVFLARDNKAIKISYETHQSSIIDPEHIAALGRAEAFYNKIFDLINEYQKLSLEQKTILVESPTAGGILTELEFGSQRPSACAVRTRAIPLFTLKTFSKEYEVQLPPRHIDETTLDSLMSEVVSRAQGIITEARDRNIMGLS